MKLLLAIAAGGALGALARHFFVAQAAHWFGTGFPWGVFLANVLGCFVMGMLVEAMALFWSPSMEMRAMLTVGILGAFTTFSSFAVDVAVLHGRGALMLAAVYVLSSVVLAVVGLFAGMAFMRALAT